MKKMFILLFVFSLMTPLMHGQKHGGWKGRSAQKFRGSVKGKVLDQTTGKPIEFASVVLINLTTQKEQDGQITTTTGKFKFIDVPIGRYRIAVSYIGYKDTSVVVTLTRKSPYVEVADIQIEPTSVLLEAAEVQGEKVLIEQSIDKVSFNADKDPTLVGGDGEDVLRKVPLLSVDQDGNVSLGGSSDVKILINGKPSTLFSTNPGDALKMLPADQVKRVEVLTSPGAKYDAEGTAGIINIVTKKNRLDGISGRVNGRAGYPQNRFGLNVNAARGRIGGSANGSFYYGIPRSSYSYFYRESALQGAKETFLREGNLDGGYFGYWGQGEVVYEIDGYNSIGSSMSWGGHNHTSNGTNYVDFSNPLLSKEESYSREEDNFNGRGRLNWSSEYTRSFDDENRLFTLGLQVESVRSVSHNTLLQSPENASQDYLYIDENQNNIGNNVEITGQVDYTHPMSKAWKLETGAKAIRRSIISDFKAASFDQSTTEYVEITDRTDVFHYGQDVYAGYLSSTYNLNKWGFMAGMRVENTSINGYFERFSSTVENQYTNWVPNLALSRKLSMTQTLKISYNQRIKRPSLFHINPFVNKIDRRNIQYGNPLLKPSRSEKIELSYSNFIMGSSILAKFFYQSTTDVVSPYTSIDSLGVAGRTFLNVGLRDEYGVNLFTSIKLGRMLTVRLGGHFKQVHITANAGLANGLKNTGYEFGGHASGTLSLPKDYSMEIMAFGRSPRITVQGFEATFWMTNFSLQRSFWNKKATLGISVVDPFWDKKVFASKLQEPGFLQESRYETPFRSVGIKFSYSFGKLKFKPKKFKSRIKNDDLLEGGDSSKGGGGMN